MISLLQNTAQALGLWQKRIVTKHKTDDGAKEIPHPATAPTSTDQEAGGASTTPDGTRLYDDTGNAKNTNPTNTEQ